MWSPCYIVGHLVGPWAPKEDRCVWLCLGRCSLRWDSPRPPDERSSQEPTCPRENLRGGLVKGGSLIRFVFIEMNMGRSWCRVAIHRFSLPSTCHQPPVSPSSRPKLGLPVRSPRAHCARGAADAREAQRTPPERSRGAVLRVTVQGLSLPIAARKPYFPWLPLAARNQIEFSLTAHRLLPFRGHNFSQSPCSKP